MEEVFYKIQNKKTLLFSTGGLEPKFTSVGKVWRRKQDVYAHFSLLVEYSKNPYCRVDDLFKVYKNCEIVAYKTTIDHTISFNDLEREAKTWPKNEEDPENSLQHLKKKKDETLKKLSNLKNLLKMKQK